MSETTSSPAARRPRLNAQVLGWSTAAGGLSLWLLAGTPWLPLVIALGVLAAARLVLPFVPRSWRAAVGPIVGVGLVVYLVSISSVWALLLVSGAVAAVHALRECRWTVFAVAALPVAVGGGVLGWQAWQHQQLLVAQRDAEHRELRARLLPQDPSSVPATVMTGIVRRDPDLTCGLFTPSAAAQFAAGWRAPDCATAVRQLFTQVQGPEWASPSPRSVEWSAGTRSTVGACALEWSTNLFGGPAPGPQLGTFRVEAQSASGSSGYLITAYRPCGQ